MKSSIGRGDTYRLYVNGSCHLSLSQDGFGAVEGAGAELVRFGETV